MLIPPVAVLAISLPATRALGGEELSGLEVARATDRARRSRTEHQVMKMTLINPRGQTRVRTIEGWSREISDDEEHRFSRFLEPSDVRDTTLLSYDYNDERDDDTWLYLPALKKVKRILSSNKKDYFMGSQFTYEDMENLDLRNWDYTLDAPQTEAGVECHVLVAVPNNEREAKETNYSKRISWIGKADMLPRKIEFYDKSGRLAKVLVFEDIRPASESNPRPRAHKLTMDNLIKKHKTVLEITKLELDVEVNDSVFSQRNLRQ
ncbi:MAG: outer membrane lipoprotein-sorting protein [Candidatus Binatia bacterium]